MIERGRMLLVGHTVQHAEAPTKCAAHRVQYSTPRDNILSLLIHTIYNKLMNNMYNVLSFCIPAWIDQLVAVT
jgi:hypothetical protein